MNKPDRPSDRPNEAGLWFVSNNLWAYLEPHAVAGLIVTAQIGAWGATNVTLCSRAASDLPAGNWRKLGAGEGEAVNDCPYFSCPECCGTYFGTLGVGEPKEQWVRVCHDQLGVGCKWKKANAIEADKECMQNEGKTLHRLRIAVDELAKNRNQIARERDGLKADLREIAHAVIEGAGQAVTAETEGPYAVMDGISEPRAISLEADEFCEGLLEAGFTYEISPIIANSRMILRRGPSGREWMTPEGDWSKNIFDAARYELDFPMSDLSDLIKVLRGE